MDTPLYDIAILGSGPVSNTLAQLLAQIANTPSRILLLRDERPENLDATALDPRALALNQGSRVLLESIDAWPDQAADILTVHVSQQGRLGRTLISHADMQTPRLGSVVTYSALHERLNQSLQATSVTVAGGPPALITGQDDRGIAIRQGQQTYHARLAVLADGQAQAPLTEGDKEAAARTRDYGQHAILATVHASNPLPGRAWERFTRQGPLALLPHPQRHDLYALVWCQPQAQAEALQALDDSHFGQALESAFGLRLGTLQPYGPRHAVPLRLAMRQRTLRGRIVTIGNAAQTLHPVAGQGLNLGLRDAAQLALALRDWLRANTPCGTPDLHDWLLQRQADRALTIGITDLLARSFSTGLSPAEHAGGLALLGLDLMPALRQPLVRHLLQGLRI